MQCLGSLFLKTVFDSGIRNNNIYNLWCICCTFHSLPSWTSFRCSASRPPHWSPPWSPDSLCVGSAWPCTQTSCPACTIRGAATSPASWRPWLLGRVPLGAPATRWPSPSWPALPLSPGSPPRARRPSWGRRRAGRWWRCRSTPWGGRGAAAWGSSPPSASLRVTRSNYQQATCVERLGFVK